MNNYIPKQIENSIYDIDYKTLLNKNIHFLLYDLDNTIIEYNKSICNQKTKELFDNIKELGITPIIFSNSPKKRVEKIAKALNIEYESLAFKPLSFKFNKILKKYHLKKDEVAIIGDQLLTDIKGGNKIGITTILVKPIIDSDGFLTKFNRKRERKIKRKLDINE